MEESIGSPVRRAAEKMSDLERGDRMFELRERQCHWADSDDHDLQEQMGLLRVGPHGSYILY